MSVYLSQSLSYHGVRKSPRGWPALSPLLFWFSLFSPGYGQALTRLANTAHLPIKCLLKLVATSLDLARAQPSRSSSTK